VGLNKDTRTRDEIICDMLADEKDFEEIAFRLQVPELSVRARFEVLKGQLGWQAQ
jgi:hypothetical protein